MKHQPEGIIGRRPPPFPTALKIRLGTTRQPGASPCHQVLANPLSDWQRAEAQHRWDLSKAPMRHWRGWDENPMSTICELKALLGNYGQVLDPLWAFYPTNYNWSERVVLGKGWAGWTRLDGPRSGPAASAQHGRVWRGEAKGVSAVGKEAASYSVYWVASLRDRLLCCKQELGVGRRLAMLGKQAPGAGIGPRWGHCCRGPGCSSGRGR